MSVLAINDLRAAYGTVRALYGVSLTLEEGETVGLLGRNGAGKTTLIKSILGDPEITVEGEVTLDGNELRGQSTHKVARKGVAWVPDDRRIFTALSVGENMELARTTSAPPDQLDKVLEHVPLVANLMDRRGYALSGGEQQAVAIGRALMSAPRFILMDEPAEGLAPVIVQRLEAAIARLPEEFGVGVLLAEQNFSFVTKLVRRVVVLSTGRVAWAGPTDELTTRQDLIDEHLSAGGRT